MAQKVCPVCLGEFDRPGVVCGDECLVKALVMESDFDRMQIMLEEVGVKPEAMVPLTTFVLGGEVGSPWGDLLAEAKQKGWVARG